MKLGFLLFAARLQRIGKYAEVFNLSLGLVLFLGPLFDSLFCRFFTVVAADRLLCVKCFLPREMGVASIALL